MEGWNTENGRWDQRWDDLAVDFSIMYTDSDGDGYQDGKRWWVWKIWTQGTVREMYQDISLSS